MSGKNFYLAASFVILLAFPAPSRAGEADVLKAAAHKNGATYTIEATIKSHDTGWDHYADAFEVLGPDGAVLAKRVLFHPHEDEQPFTRDVSGVVIPAGISRVTIRAHHNTAGYDGSSITIDLPR